MTYTPPYCSNDPVTLPKDTPHTPVGAVVVHPDDDPTAPDARRYLLTDDDPNDLPWVRITGHDRVVALELDLFLPHDHVIGWPAQSLADLGYVLGHATDAREA